ncbi:hypothetical protein G7009_24975 [Pseudomonas capeferrum]|uniref:hypothetical protein n=1 Tax=Pseudomonas capeferrum TaxID=1495066 RepID=UPI0015E36A82|nr:hypothetical protein [Pseudomonas capeferrum]MBA1204974.1 hypothetical protein [Pseudomonas capeferrum]
MPVDQERGFDFQVLELISVRKTLGATAGLIASDPAFREARDEASDRTAKVRNRQKISDPQNQ